MGKRDKKYCYNPYRQFQGVFIPDWLLERKELSPSAKIVFGLLTKAAGCNGECFIGREKIAAKLNVTTRSAQKYLNELYDCELILPIVRSGVTNKYKFLDHPWINWKNKQDVKFEVVNDRSGGDVKVWGSYPQPVNDRSGGVVNDRATKNPNLHIPSERSFRGVVNDRSHHIKEVLKEVLKESPKRENQIVDNFYFFEAANLDGAEETKAFEKFLTTYPKNPHLMNLHQLRNNWAKRRQDGYTAKKMIEGAHWYRECCRAKNLIGERAIMGINRFLGEERHFSNDWKIEFEEMRRSTGYNPRN